MLEAKAVNGHVCISIERHKDQISKLEKSATKHEWHTRTCKSRKKKKIYIYIYTHTNQSQMQFIGSSHKISLRFFVKQLASINNASSTFNKFNIQQDIQNKAMIQSSINFGKQKKKINKFNRHREIERAINSTYLQLLHET
ncbi:hypothetical protein L1049_018841 [Liquidambar formosana]|uniref:Uncharacterized protein n=1 Tax=Liquidambar formosana TaxID=63359 RepID=A0AAP0WMA7_LIQFO